MSEPLLSLTDVNTSYGNSHVLQDISLSVDEDDVVALLGRNGAGKTTTLRSIIGTQPPFKGHITYRGEDITKEKVYERASRGIKLVPEDRRVFETLTVHEHLTMAVETSHQTIEEELSFAYETFPALEEMQTRQAGNLSGGEQQMLAIARALIGPTDLLMLDEPSEGLAPQIVESIFQTLLEIRQENTILLVEQNYQFARALADHYYILDQGRIVSEGLIDELDANDELKQQYLGVT